MNTGHDTIMTPSQILSSTAIHGCPAGVPMIPPPRQIDLSQEPLLAGIGTGLLAAVAAGLR